MMTMNDARIESLYAHFPFCESKCHYCDFFSLPEAQVAEGERARVFRAILAELERARPRLSPVLRTIFLGGGTPSLVPLDAMAAFLDLAAVPAGAGTEITMEANPSSISAEKARAWKAVGITRVSMGLQALDDRRLEWLGRAHSSGEAHAALEALFEAGFERVSVDYIVGVPDQTVDLIGSELNRLLGRFPMIDHVSAYLLTLRPSNPRASRLPSEDEQLAHLRRVRDVLADRGFEQYEISNFARAGARALHNENYWLGGGYLGVGPSAHSHDAAARRRWKNWASLGKYCDLIEAGQEAAEWTETLTEEQLRLEYLLLRLRRREGIRLDDYEKRFGRRLYDEKRAWIDAWLKTGHCELNDHLRLKGDGFFLSDKIVSNLV